MFNLVQSLSHVQIFAIPWIAARQASLSITNSRSVPKSMSIESVMSSNHLILCCPLLLLPPILLKGKTLGYFPMSQLFAWGGQSIGVSASTSALPMNTQDWFPLGWIQPVSSFTFIKRLLSSSSLSVIRVVSSAYLRLLIFLPAILIPACVSF